MNALIISFGRFLSTIYSSRQKVLNELRNLCSEFITPAEKILDEGVMQIVRIFT